MKITTLSTLLAAAILGLASCNKQYNTEVSDSQTGSTNNNTNSNFNWSGTAPLSVKANGVFFQATTVNVTEAFGYYYISGHTADGNTSFGPSVPVNAPEGQVYSMPSPANVTWQSNPVSGPMALGAYNGKCKVVTNNATILEGYFWADTKDYSMQRDTVVRLTEGYFKVDKP